MNFGIRSIRHPYRFFKWAICRITHTPKTLYITFDDGPDPNTTEKVLKILKEFNVKATFFCTGQNAENCEYLIQKILEEGHAIGNHGYYHLDANKTKSKIWIENVLKNSPVSNSIFFRPPYGRVFPLQIRKLRSKYRLIFWDVMTYDFKLEYTPEDVKKIIKKYVRDGSIIVFHDNILSVPRMIPALKFLIMYYKRKNYNFASINL
ncbi:MAG: polysaccharide deacetylase family protein [Bacteroidales bacterium]|jgi:peptidoglycan/xylan/chitin deacetylase (PgdA/CDA1 family)|nr:polysaccharide deacetylase family protein [Bacteroidales bacterium]HOL98448.1 polysaccharide deacetylase family protein [Bacteroidales bacterium]HOM35928.1 polysaccharide deacetylase family protein [Bacteroidales bacterium]HPD24352.1 polysaccharide deacetylase family protein [Bacteroidales bacterium]HRT00182.1 polysaccharide deacetylase family protein [Bacteroidales bacterium]